MSDKIKLELGDPFSDSSIEEVLSEAPSAVSTIADSAADVAQEAASDAPAQAEMSEKYLEDVNLTAEEQQMVDEFSEKIDLHDTNVILHYGAAAQKKIAAFSDAALEGVKTKDLGTVGNDVAALVTELKGFDVDGEKTKGFLGLFKKKIKDIATLKARYDTTEANVDKITEVLENHQNQLLTDIVMLDKMYDSNLSYFKELTMYILAGKKKLEEEQSTTLVELQKAAQESGLAEDAQKANDFAALCDRFEKKLYDLELTRTISMQMAPQIRLIQNSDTLMTEKIQSTINNTIPLWKNQMVLALGMSHSEEAMKAQKLVTDFTNELIKENAEKLKQSTIEIAEESEKGIVDIESVKYANEQLIESLTEVVRIQEEGREQRRVAENELGQIEATLKQKLLDIRNSAANAAIKPDFVKEEVQDAADTADAAVEDIAKDAADTVDAAKDAAEDIAEDAADAVDAAKDAVEDIAEDVAEAVKDVAEDAVEAVKDVSESVSDTAEEFFEDITE